MTGVEERQVCEHLLALSRQRAIQFGKIFSWYVVERLVHRLEQSSHREALLLDGDLLVHAFTGKEVPVQWRASLTWRPARASAKLSRAFHDLCRVDGRDHVRFGSAVQVSAVSRPSIRVRQFEVIVTGRLCGADCPVSFLVTKDMSREFDSRDVPFPCLIDGELRTRPKACAPEVFMARRVRELSDAGITHLNPQAYSDLHRLIEAGTLQEGLAIQALATAFRDVKPRFPPNLPLAFTRATADNPDLRQIWETYQQRARMRATELPGVLGSIERYLTPLFDAARAVIRKPLC